MKKFLLLIFGLLPLVMQAQEETTVTEDFRVTCRAYSVDGMKPKPGTPLKADAKNCSKSMVCLCACRYGLSHKR